MQQQMTRYLCLLALAIIAVGSSPSRTAPTVFLIGDSTMADRPYPVSVHPERGWGQVLAQFLQPEVKVENHARNGRSTKSFIEEGRWETVLESLQSGDYVLIQFGHNDQKYKDPTRYTNPASGYYNNLLRFVEETRAKGATPILLTSIVRRKFNEFGTLQDTHGLYPLVVRQVATDHNVAFIDHLSLTESFVASLGDIPSREYYMWIEAGKYEALPDGKQDDTHLTLKGAIQYARFVAEAIQGSELPLREYVVLD